MVIAVGEINVSTTPVTVRKTIGSNGNGKTTNGKTATVRSSQRRSDLNPALVLALGQSPASIAAQLRLERLSKPNGHESTNGQNGRPKIKFNPLQSPHGNKSIVTLRGKATRESRTFVIEYEPSSIPNPNEIPRDQIKLQGIPEEKILKAKTLAQEIKKEFDSVTRIKDISIFRNVFETKIKTLADSTNDFNSTDTNDTELFILTAYFCLVQNGGFLSKLPDGLLNNKDDSLPEMIRVLGRYFIVNVHELDTAAKVERFEDWRNKLPEAGLARLYDFFSPADLLKISFPGYLDSQVVEGRYVPPPIREYLLPGNKWQGDSTLLTRACQDIFQSQGVVDEKGFVKREAVMTKDWSQVFRDRANGINGAMGDGNYLCGAIDALDRAVPGLVGIQEHKGQISPWRLEYLFIIDDSDEGRTRLDQITRYIVEEKLKLFDEHGKVSAQKLREVRDWVRQYDQEKRDCLIRAKVTNAEEALKRVYPDLFGWGDGQIQPGEIKYGDKWKGRAGRRLFALRFAKSIQTVCEHLKRKGVEGFQNHGVYFYPNETPPIQLPKTAFNRLKNYYIENGITWWDHYLWFNLTGGFLTVAGNQENAFTIMLGKVNSQTGTFGKSDITIDDVKERNPKRASIVTELLAEIDIEYSSKDTKIKELHAKEYSETYTGIQGTCLEPILAYNPQAQATIKTQALYDAYMAAIIPTQDKDKLTKENDKFTALEKILVARSTACGAEGELVLSDRGLNCLLITLKEDIIPNINGSPVLKSRLIFSVEQILSVHKPYDSPRELLISATETERKFGHRNNLLSLLNDVLENIFEAIAIHELQSLKFNSACSPHYQRILDRLEIEDVIED